MIDAKIRTGKKTVLTVYRCPICANELSDKDVKYKKVITMVRGKCLVCQDNVMVRIFNR